jgi:LacI family transcriptional regulator
MPFLSHDPASPDPAILEDDMLPVPYRRDGMTLRVLQGAMSVLKEAGYRLVIHSNRELADEMHVLHNLHREGLDGAIVMPSCGSEDNPFYADYINLAKSGLPVVLVDTYFPDCPLDHVVTDNANGAKQAVQCLISQGHRRIAHFTDFGQVTSTMDREVGYRLALEEAGIGYDEQLVCGPQLAHRKQWSFQYALEHCLRLPDPITAVFCHNDDVMLLTLREARSLGISVPGDFAIAGFFDDSVPAGMEVPFTRVVQSKNKMGRIAAKLLLERLSGVTPPTPRRICLAAELIPASHR